MQPDVWACLEGHLGFLNAHDIAVDFFQVSVAAALQPHSLWRTPTAAVSEQLHGLQL